MRSLACACACACALAASTVLIEVPAVSPSSALRLASAELSRYLADLGVTSRAARARVVTAPIAAGSPADLIISLAIDASPFSGGAGYSLGGAAASASGGAARLAVSGSDAQHALYGTYALLERLGMTFSTAGPTLPSRVPDVAALAAALAAAPLAQTPAFSTRGLQPFHDFAE